MTKRIMLFLDLRSKGFALRDSVRISEVDWLQGLFFAGLFVAVLCLAYMIDSWAEEKAEQRAAPHRAQAEENLRAFNHAMNGKSFVIENEWRALFTCKAQEMKL